MERIACNTLPYVKWMASGNLPGDSELKLGLCDNLQGWHGVRGGRETQEGGGTCLPVGDSG